MTQNKPDNSRLIALLDEWSKDMSNNNYANVRTELLEGNSILMLPSDGGTSSAGEWTAVRQPTKIRLASLYTVEGVKTLGAFTDTESVLRWSKGKQVFCNSLLSRVVFEICEKNGIKRIVINSGSENIFPLTYQTSDEIFPCEQVW